MKKLVCLFLCFSLAASINALNAPNEQNEQIVLTLFAYPGFDPTTSQNEPPKAPVRTPVVYISNGVLSFNEVYADAVPVELRDASGNVVYSDYLPAGVQTLSLPTTLSGTYTLFIYIGNYVFAGSINL